MKRQAFGAVITCGHGELWRHSNTGQPTVAATGVAWRVEVLKQTRLKIRVIEMYEICDVCDCDFVKFVCKGICECSIL
jgi:hypothetical protein